MTFEQDMRRFEEKTLRQIRYVVVNATQDVIEGAQTSARGKTVGGSLIEGRIPVVSSDLINSLVSQVNGSAVAKGVSSYAVALATMKIGDTLRFAWTMSYARRVNSGFTGTDASGRFYSQEGWHFVDYNAARWKSLVAHYARKAAL